MNKIIQTPIKYSSNTKLSFWTGLLLLLSIPRLTAQIDLFQVIEDYEMTEIKIETDLQALIKHKRKPIYQKAAITFTTGKLNGKVFSGKVKARGNLRRKICYYPPIKIKLDKTEIAFNTIKWVNICKNSALMESYLLKEFLAYRLYGLLTENSFKTRLFKASFVNPEDGKTLLVSYGFLIEPIKSLAFRTNSKEYEPAVPRPRILDPYHYGLMNVFEYLIGNTDWHIDNLHNLKLLRNQTLKAVIPIPYDFDYCGLVNASYAVPHESIPIENVSIRYNKGHCLSEDILEKVIAQCLSQKNAMIEMINQFEYLSEKSRRNLSKYIQKGFEDLEHPKKARKIFLQNCEKLSR